MSCRAWAENLHPLGAYLPELRANLVAALATLDVHNLTHPASGALLLARSGRARDYNAIPRTRWSSPNRTPRWVLPVASTFNSSQVNPSSC